MEEEQTQEVGESMVEEFEDERLFTIPLRKAKAVPRTKRAKRAIKELRSYVARHMKALEDDVWIDTHVNEAIWARGIQKIPSRIRVKAIKFEDGLVEVSLPEEREEAEEEEVTEDEKETVDEDETTEEKEEKKG